MRQVPIPGPSSRQHTTLSHKRYSITISSTYHRDNGEYVETTRLPWIAGRGSTIIPFERHDSSGAQRRQLLKRARSTQPSGRTLLPVQWNGAVLNIAHIIKNVMSSATEAELAGLYIMAREAVYIRIILEELGHKQCHGGSSDQW